jgi:hypothetical protein
MTIIGIAGGTALLLTGFGLRDSISGTADKQFSEVTHYDATVALNHSNQATKAQQLLQTNVQHKLMQQLARSKNTASILATFMYIHRNSRRHFKNTLILVKNYPKMASLLVKRSQINLRSKLVIH